MNPVPASMRTSAPTAAVRTPNPVHIHRNAKLLNRSPMPVMTARAPKPLPRMDDGRSSAPMASSVAS